MKKRMWMRGAAAASLVVAMVTAGAQGGPARNVDSPAEMQPGGDPQAKDDLLEGLDKLGANAKERNEVNLDKNMLALAGGKKGGRYAGMADKMEFIVVRNYEFASKGQYQKSDLDTLRHRLEGNGWSHIVRNESDGETNDIVVKTDQRGLHPRHGHPERRGEGSKYRSRCEGASAWKTCRARWGRPWAPAWARWAAPWAGAMGRVAAAQAPEPPDPPAHTSAQEALVGNLCCRTHVSLLRRGSTFAGRRPRYMASSSLGRGRSFVGRQSTGFA